MAGIVLQNCSASIASGKPSVGVLLVDRAFVHNHKRPSKPTRTPVHMSKTFPNSSPISWHTQPSTNLIALTTSATLRVVNKDAYVEELWCLTGGGHLSTFGLRRNRSYVVLLVSCLLLHRLHFWRHGHCAFVAKWPTLNLHRSNNKVYPDPVLALNDLSRLLALKDLDRLHHLACAPAHAALSFLATTSQRQR